MTEATRVQIERKRMQSFGVEVEMNSITREKAAQTAAAYFGTESVSKGTGLYTWEAKDQQGRTWSFQRDTAIYTVAGLMLITLAGVLMIRRKRKYSR